MPDPDVAFALIIHYDPYGLVSSRQTMLDVYRQEEWQYFDFDFETCSIDL